MICLRKVKNKMKLVLVVFTILLLGVFAFTACGNYKKITNNKNKTKSWKISDDNETTLNTKELCETGKVDEEETTKEERKEETIKENIEQKNGDIKALHIEGNKLKDSNGNNVQLRGVSTHGIAWFPQYINQEFFFELKDEWNVNVIRLAMYTAEYNGYCSGGDKENLKNLIRNGVEYAKNANMYVIIDWHILQDGNPNQNKEEAKAFFEEMSKEYATYDNVLYEICNEPNGEVTWSDIKAYANELIPVIRKNDNDAIIIVGTPTWSQDIDKVLENPITEYDNIIYSLHFYAATHTEWLRERAKNVIDKGLPIFVTEFGTCDASGNGNIDINQSNEWIKLLDENNISYVAWNLSNKNESSAIFNSNCNKVSGFELEDLSENGRWIYEMLSGK